MIQNNRSASPANQLSSDREELPSTTQNLNDFVMQLEDYTPTIPDTVIGHYLHTAGFDASDPRILRLISLAAQKFISEIANDALQHCKTRANNAASSHSSNKNPKNLKDRRYTLTTDDLSPALLEFGITIKKPHYFV